MNIPGVKLCGVRKHGVSAVGFKTDGHLPLTVHNIDLALPAIYYFGLQIRDKRRSASDSEGGI